MSSMTLRSNGAADEAGNVGPEAGLSIANTAETISPAGNATTEANVASNNVTLSRAEYEAIQAIICQETAVPPSAAVPGSVAAPVNTAAPVATPVTASVSDSASVPVVALFYRGKAPKINWYSGGSRGLYNKFIRQCQTVFDVEENHTDAGQVAFGSARLDNIPANV